jgi:hypothetical protein
MAEELVRIDPENGAYLVWAYTTETTDDCTPDETYSAAGSVLVAKRVARKMAERLEYEGPFRWHQEGRSWVLTGTIPEPEIDDAEW